MKNVTIGTKILAAAALTFSAPMAFAQDATKLKAEIPFSFHFSRQQYPAGTYETSMIVINSGARVLKIVNAESGAPRIALPAASAYPKNAAEKESGPRFVFQCNAHSTPAPGASGCALAQVWTGYETGMQFSMSAPKRGESMHLAVVRMRPASAD